MSQRVIIGFAGAAYSGKSTAAMRLVAHHGFQRIRFAGVLKDMMKVLGLTDREIEGEAKELPCALLGGKTPRLAMQTLGTEWGRDIIDRDLWVRAWRARVDQAPAGVGVVIDDCRFPNEAQAIRAAGGKLFRIVREGAARIDGAHESERHELPVDAIIQNPDGDLRAFYASVDALPTAPASWARAA